MGNEVELKLRIARRDAARLRRHPALLAALSQAPYTRKLTSIYYDTPDLRLLDAGVSLRVRRMAGGWFQAVKAAGSSRAGLHQRMEWEDVIAAGEPDFTRILDPELVRLFANQALRDALRPIFRTEVRRTDWQLDFADAKVEVALDLGELVIDAGTAGEAREPISEIELELKEGNAGRLFALALELQRDIPLALENVSKAQRGYARFRPAAPAIAKARMPVLDRDTSAADAFRLIAWECIAHLQGNQDMVLHGSDVEGVHQMRVALRRLRSAFAVFGTLIPQDRATDLLAELHWITGVLGTARDLDVFLSETLPPLLARFEQHAGLLRLQQRASVRRCDAYHAVREALQGQRFQRLLLSLGTWLENEAREIAQSGPSAAALAEAVLQKRYKRLLRHGRRLAEMQPAERHRTRIAAKKLRYAAEFFASLYPSGQSHGFIRRLSQLQDRLGVLNDIEVTEGLLRQLQGSRPERAVAEAGLLLAGWNARAAMQGLDGLERAWNDFAGLKPYWRPVGRRGNA